MSMEGYSWMTPGRECTQMRCYFHLVNSQGAIRDDVGIEVSDLQTTRHQAIKAIHELRQESDGAEEEWRGWQLDVADAEGNIILAIPLDLSLQ
jgi:hypothetical protein